MPLTKLTKSYVIVTLPFQILTIWGLIGVHTDKFGFKHVWEICLLTPAFGLKYQAFYDLTVCSWYAYSQTMVSEVSPLPQMFLFLALFSVIGKTSCIMIFIAIVPSAIIIAGGNNDHMPFAFFFGL
ncbi:Autophagy-related protein [Mycena sanguinolenta]|uniref:Autophagy-related protein n=1 Tax=Mycena sanguinolenta TaxID=230812 RepID=A0A8H6ZBQ8_9AGAR|nr:Autophagy-related protein [Mycena sanguinolenta]